MKGITEKPIVLIDKEDFQDVINKFQIDQIHLKVVEVEEAEDEKDKIE